MSEFQDKVVLIVGGAGGLGQAAARSLACLGAKVALVDLGCERDGSGHDPHVVERAAEEIALLGVETLGVACDAGLPHSARAMLDATLAKFGRVDLGVYCAGFHHERSLTRESDEQLSRVLDVHLLGAVRFTRELCRHWVENKERGSIVLTASASAFLGSANQSALAIAAGGLVGFVKTAAAELRRQAIRVNAVVPTARTRLTENLPLFESIRADSLTPEHVAQAVCHLLSDAAVDVRGEVIGVAGGRIHAYRHLETSGAFFDGAPADLSTIAASWQNVTRR